jgi:hypothetical protein
MGPLKGAAGPPSEVPAADVWVSIRASLIDRSAALGTAPVYGRALRCLVYDGREFWDREAKLNSSGIELFNLAWANQSALGLLCAGCGYVHEFVGEAVARWDRDR